MFPDSPCFFTGLDVSITFLGYSLVVVIRLVCFCFGQHVYALTVHCAIAYPKVLAAWFFPPMATVSRNVDLFGVNHTNDRPKATILFIMTMYMCLKNLDWRRRHSQYATYYVIFFQQGIIYYIWCVFQNGQCPKSEANFYLCLLYLQKHCW